MHKTLYRCDICGMKTFDKMFKYLIPVLYHVKFDDDLKYDKYGWANMFLCPECLDRLTFFRGDGNGGMIAREGMLPNPGIEIPDSEKADWSIVRLEHC